MRAVTIAVGPAWEAMAALAAASVRQHLGLEPEIIRDVGDCRQPAKYKLRLLERFRGETVLYFDADCRVLRPWLWEQFEDCRWPVVVLDWPSRARDQDCRGFRIDADRYFASGFWIANARHQSHRDAWAAARTIAEDPTYRTAFKYEQTALNCAVQRAGLPLTLLDRRHWWITTLDHPAPQDVAQIALGGALHGPDRAAYDAALEAANCER